MRRRWLWLASPLLLALLLLAALAIDATWLRPLVQQVVQQRSGRQVDFERLKLGLDGAMRPTLRVYRLQVQNARWASPQPLVSAAELGMTLSWRSLFGEPLIVTRLVLVDAELDLERQADGLRNWRLTRPDDRGPGRVRVLSVDAQRTRARIVHGGEALVMQLASTPLATPQQNTLRPDLPLTRALQFSGSRHGVAFEGQAEVSDVVTLFDTGEAFALRGEVGVAGSRLQVDGVGSDVLGPSGLDARLRYWADREDLLWRLLGLASRPTSLAAELQARVQKVGQRWSVSALQARLGGSDVAGELVFDEDGHGLLQGTLHSRTLAAGELGRLRAEPPSGTPAPPTPAGRLAGLEARLDWSVDTMELVPRLTLSAVKAHLALRQQQLVVAPLAFGMLGGQGSGRMVLDRSGAPHQASLDLRLQGLRPQQLAAAGSPLREVAGTLDARLALTSQGDSMQALAGAAQGQLSATLAGASVPAALEAKLGLDGGRWLSSKFKPDERAAITCSALSLNFERGRGRVQRLALETPQVVLTGSGWLDLSQRRLEMTVAPQRKKAALLALDRWVLLRGPLADVGVTLIPPGGGQAGPGCAALGVD